MIGSLAQFIPIQGDSILQQQKGTEQAVMQSTHLTKRRGKSAFESYHPDDKTDLLVRFEKNNIYSINRKKYHSIAQQAKSSEKIRKPLVQHHSFFVKPQITKDYIAKEEKHNLLRAIMRMKQNQQEPNKQTDYEQSFQRLYKGFKNIHPQPILKRKQQKKEEVEAIPTTKKLVMENSRDKGGLGKHKRLEFEHCLSWAKKHNKKGDYFAQQLGKNKKILHGGQAIQNRSLIDDIGKKLNLNWLE